MINCKRCKHYYKAFGAYSICYYEEPCSLKNHDGKCTYYEAKFPYNFRTWLKRGIEYLLPKKVYCSGTSQDTKKRNPDKPADNKYGHHWGKRRHLGYAVCDWCNAVENTNESVTRCPMAKIVEIDGEEFWALVFGEDSLPFQNTVHCYYRYPEPSYAPFPEEQE